MTTKRPPTYLELLNYIKHSENEALYGEGILNNLTPGQLLARVEAHNDTKPGNWFFGPFNDLAQAKKYIMYIANLGQRGIRQNSALPHVWPGGYSGNSVDVIRIYRVIYPTPAIASFAAPQDETGAVMATPRQIAAVRAGTYRHMPKYEGQGHQLSLPVSGALKHDLELVERVKGEEYKITKA